MKRDFLGQGWRFPVGTDSDGGIEDTGGHRNIEEAITVILGTAKGERVMRPDFGCGIHDHVFDTVDVSTRTLIEASVEEALIEWEPRIEVQDVTVTTDRLDAGRLDVSIDYRIRRTTSEHNMVYPLYVEGD